MSSTFPAAPSQSTTELKDGNDAFRHGRYIDALRHYIRALRTPLRPERLILENIARVRRRLLGSDAGTRRLRVGVCGWELSHNAAGRVYCLAQLYSEFADTEIVGSMYSQWGREIWEPIRNSPIPKHVFLVERAANFIDQAIELVLTHPFDLVHLSKPRAPNLIFGILYKSIWDATVIVDIDDEELAFIGESDPLEFSSFLRENGALPSLMQLTGREWTRLAVGAATMFDGVSVSNPALQKRYGGVLVPHVRNEKVLQPTRELREQGRRRLGVEYGCEVVLFFGTPREHKGLLEIGRTIKELNRDQLIFAVVGDFPDLGLKEQLTSICGKSCIFLGNQPFESMASIVAAGDVCIILLSSESPVSEFQVPAKLTDALAMGLKVLLEPSPAVADILGSGAAQRVDSTTLSFALESVLDSIKYPNIEMHRIDSDERRFFLEQLSFAAVIPRIRKALMEGGAWSRKAMHTDILSNVVLHTAEISHLASLVKIAQVVNSQGVSIIVLTYHGAALLDRLLGSFFATNTYQPIELLIIDHGSDAETAEVVAKFHGYAPIKHIKRGGNYSFAASCNFAAELATYPRLLFLNNDIKFSADLLANAVGKLEQNDVGVVGVRLDDVAEGKSTQAVNHYGVRFAWNERRGYFMPEQLRSPTREEFHEKFFRQDGAGGRDNSRPLAVTGAFILCRKGDFSRVGGFDENYDYGLEDIDLCLKIRRDLGKGCYCIGDQSLEHAEGSTRKKLVAPDRLDRNHEFFKTRWAQFIKEIIYEPAEENYVEKMLREIEIPEVPLQQLKVTIILAVYGKLKYTLRCLKSIAESTPACYDIVLMDDCSPDDSGEFLSRIKNIKYHRNPQNLGFLLSCNRGIEFSRGGHILYLNNDTEVRAKWLDTLLEVLERPGVGAVGSKLVYPDGSLQEAGGIYWRDAQGTNYGRKDSNPDKPEYNFVREVDKCSGASLLVRKEIIEQTKGFDPRFAPAYKEDADLCFEVRRLGYKVMYQPLSVVVHYEGISCGDDTSGGIKKYQVLNQPKFVEKWRDVLNTGHMENRRTNVFVARSRPPDSPYLLIIDDKLPEYDRHAGGLGMYQYTMLLKEMGYRVIYYPDNKKRTEPYATQMEQAGIEVKYEVSTAAFKTWIEEHGQHLKYVWLSRPSESAKYIDVLRKFSNAKILYCGRDLHYLRHYRRYEVEKDPAFLRSSKEYKEKEFRLFNLADAVLLFSDLEAELISKEGVDPRKIRIIPAYYYDRRQPPKLDALRNEIVFVGGGKHQPNVDAVLWFVEHCFPHLEKRFPSIKFRIIGPDPSQSVLDLARQNIEIMGYVEDLEDIYANARVTIAPLRYGAGVKGKIVNSLSFGIPVATTSVGMEGMGLVHDVNCLCADTPDAFVDAVTRLLTDDLCWARISKSGLGYIADIYSKDAASKCMKEIFSYVQDKKH